jgi:hypothetical protein
MSIETFEQLVDNPLERPTKTEKEHSMSYEEWSWRMEYCRERLLHPGRFWDIAGNKYAEFIEETTRGVNP